MGRGRRYNNDEPKLNIKKVVAVIITILVIIMFVILIRKFATTDTKNSTEKKTANTYYTMYDNDKWGIINSQGETVISPMYDEMVIVPNYEKAVFVVTYNVNYENETYSSKAVNDKNEQLFTNYDKVEVIENYDKQNNLWYEKSCLKVQKDGKYGLIDLSGKTLLSCEYDSIEPIIGESNSLITIKDNKKGLVSTTGSIIVDNLYSDIEALTSKYEDGYIVKDENGKVGVIGTNKKILLPIEYEDIKHVYSDNTYVAKLNGKWQIVNAQSNESTEFNYDDATQINNGYIVVRKNNKYGIITTKGEETVSQEYDSLSYIFLNSYIASKDGKFGVIDVTGATKLNFTYNNLTYIKEADILEGENDTANTDLLDRNFEVKLSGIVSQINTEIGYLRLRISTEYKYFNFKFEEKKSKDVLTTNTLFLDKKNGKYGFVDKNGIVVIDYIYDDATEQNETGYVAVKKDGKWGAIDSKGKTIVEPKYDLNDNPVINFIGAWHLAQDLNANYYVK